MNIKINTFGNPFHGISTRSDANPGHSFHWMTATAALSAITIGSAILIRRGLKNRPSNKTPPISAPQPPTRLISTHLQQQPISNTTLVKTRESSLQSNTSQPPSTVQNLSQTTPNSSACVELPKEPKHPVSSAPTLDELLHIACLNEKAPQCAHLIKMRANPNASDGKGNTPLQKALNTSNASQWKILSEILPKCKTLLDHGAEPCLDDIKKIHFILRDYFPDTQYSSAAMYIQRPYPNTPEVFFNGDFQSLEDLSQKNPQALDNLKREIILFNIADEPFCNVFSYGNMTRRFGKQFNPWYEKVANHCTVIRVLVDHREQLIPIIDLVKKYLPNHSITHYVLNGHANPQIMLIGPLGIAGVLTNFTIKDETLMQEIAKRIDSSGAISMWGCESALGDSNIAKIFSKNAKGRLVFGTSNKPMHMTLNPLNDQLLGRTLLIPIFIGRNDQTDVQAFAHGLLVASGSINDQSFLNKIFANLKLQVPVLD